MSSWPLTMEVEAIIAQSGIAMGRSEYQTINRDSRLPHRRSDVGMSTWIRIDPSAHHRTGIRRLLVAGILAGLIFVAPWNESSGFAEHGAARSETPKEASFQFLIGVAPLCGLAADACPAIAMAPNGETIEITGSGTLSTHPKTVSGSGSYVHRDGPYILATGSWTAVSLLNFRSFGCSWLGDCAGRARIVIRLSPDSGGGGTDAILRVTALLEGISAPPGARRGVRLNIQDVVNFNQEVSGPTLLRQVPTDEDEEEDEEEASTAFHTFFLAVRRELGRTMNSTMAALAPEV